MKTEIRYNDKSESVNDAVAVADVRKYLGARWETLKKIMSAVNEGDKINNFYGAMMITGIEGYPVEALKRTFMRNRLEDFKAYDAQQVVEGVAA